MNRIPNDTFTLEYSIYDEIVNVVITKFMENELAYYKDIVKQYKKGKKRKLQEKKPLFPMSYITDAEYKDAKRRIKMAKTYLEDFS